MDSREGDDLEDDLDYTFDAGEVSEGEPVDRVSEEEFLDSATDDENTPVTKSSDDIWTRSKTTKKRKNESTTEKLKQKKKQKVQDQVETTTSIYNGNPYLIANHLSKIVRMKNPDLSTLEINDIVPSEDQVYDTSDFVDEKNDDNFAAFIKKYLSHLIPNNDKKMIMVLAISAIRVCDINRVFKDEINGGSLKLIKKNSLKYDENALKLGKSSIAVTTTGRLNKLIEAKLIDTSSIAAIVVDASYRDVKMHQLLNEPGVVQDLRKLCNLSSKPKIYVY